MENVIEEANIDEEHEKNSENGFGKRHIQVILMFMCVFICIINRVNMSVAIIAMTDHSNSTLNIQTFEWDKKTQDVILSSFFWGYTIMNIPSGHFAHKYGAKILLLCALFLNGFTSLIIPWGSKIGGWKVLCACRAIQGFTQASLLPCVHNLLSKWIPHSERSRVTNFVFTGTPLGTIIGLPLSSILASSSYGWPSIFYVIGVGGIFSGLLWHFYGIDNPSKHLTISEEEKKYIENSLGKSDSNKVLKTPWKSILTSLPVFAIIVAHTGCNWGFLTFLVEIPSYLKHALGIDVKNSGILSALPYTAMWIGGISLSFLSDYLVNNKIITTTVSRKVFNSIGTWLPAIGLIILGYVSSGNDKLAVGILTISVGLTSGMNMGFLMNNIDLTPNFAGTLIGITNSVANCIGILAPITVGLVLTDEKQTSEWRIVFFISAAILIFSNLFFVIFSSSEKQQWNEPFRDNVTGIENDGKHTEEMKMMLKE